MKFQRMQVLTFLFTVGFFLLGHSSVMAHEDPHGEVHPTIEILNDSFLVTARDNTHDGEDERVVIRRVDRAGNVLDTRAELRSLPPFKPYDSYSFFPELPEKENGIERRVGETWLIFPEWHRKHGGRPYFIKKEENAFSYHGLLWKNQGVTQVVDALINNDDLYLLVTRFDQTYRVQLWLHRFSVATLAEEGEVRLPDPCLIWSFPVCSNLVLHGNMVYTAIVKDRFRGEQLILVGWDGSSGSSKSKFLTNRVDWNTHVALAHIGDDALVAYHYPFRIPFLFFKPTSSKVQVIHTKLDIP